MNKNNLPQGFSPFAWALAAFCLPALLWPLALLISPAILKNQALSQSQMDWMSNFFWLYPFVLGLIARLAFKLHSGQPKAAKILLALSAFAFYGILIYVVRVGLS